LNPAPWQRFASAGEATRVFAELVEQLDRPAIVAPARDTSSAVAAAVAAPLLFQDLPKPSPRASSAGPAAASVGQGEAPLSSRPPGFSAPRAATTEHVAGLPAKPPVALLAAAGAGLLSLLALAAFGVSRLLSHSEVSPPAVSAAPSAPSAIAAGPATHGSAEPSIAGGAPEGAQAAPKTGATFVCAPVSCEWIVCDGENVKKGQLELSLPPGKHSCSASRYGYRTAVTEFQVEAGKSTRVLFELLRAKATAPTPAKSSADSKAKIGAETTKKGAASKTTKTAKPAASSKSTKGR
jgi:hypothetical protein